MEVVEAVLARCEGALEAGGPVDLRALGFWQAVGTVKRQPELVEAYADRIGAIDRRAFLQSGRPVFPTAFGAAVLGLGTAVSLALIAAAYYTPRRWRGPALLAGTVGLIGSTHGLVHLAVGRLVGIRFSHWFIGLPPQVQPGFKVDYAAYLRAPARSRAWMHASGALVTKAIPFLLLGAARAAGVPRGPTAALLGLGGAQILTDVLFSTRFSDWKRFRREMRAARALGPGRG